MTAMSYKIIFVLIFILVLNYIAGSYDNELDFSHETGFYNEEFYLSISGHGGKIYYTFDSSEPDENSFLYTGPILISDASSKPNVYSTITDVSLDYSPDLLKEADQTPYHKYVLPDHPVDKAAVLRAVEVFDDGHQSEICTKVYFIGFDHKIAYENTGIIAVITDPGNLFDFENGIYITGKTFSDSLVGGRMIIPAGSYYEWQPANYRNRGSEWERPSQIFFFDDNKQLQLSGTFGIRIQGGGSRAYANKNLNIFARNEYGSGNIPARSLFNDGNRLVSLNLNSGAQATNTKLNDYLANLLMTDLNIAVREYKPYQLFLDGEYWGAYWLIPRFDEDYFSSHFRVYSEDIIYIKAGTVEIGNENDLDYYTGMKEFITQNDMSIEENYKKACDLIDIDSFIDYYAAEIYIGNKDWPLHNWALWRTRNRTPGQYSDGKWRWILYDVNDSMHLSQAESDDLIRAMDDGIFASLIYNESFFEQFRQKLLYLSDNTFNPATVNRFIDNYEEMMKYAISNEYSRFYGNQRTVDNFITDCERIRDFFEARYRYVKDKYGR